MKTRYSGNLKHTNTCAYALDSEHTRPYSTGTALQLSYAKRISQRVKCGIKPNKRKRERRKRRNLSHDGAIMHTSCKKHEPN
jgi:hypothetical protein